MNILAIGSGSVAIYIGLPELSQYSADPSHISLGDAKTILEEAMVKLGRDYSGAANLELYPGKNELLIFANVSSGSSEFYTFDCLEDLISAVKACPEGIISSVVYSDGQYVLVLRPWDGFPSPSAPAEFGKAIKLPADFSHYLAEHGTVIASPNAVDVFKHFF